MKAYKVYLKGWPESIGFYLAKNAGKARYAAYLAATEACFKVSLIDFVALRAPEFDKFMEDKTPGKGYSLEYLAEFDPFLKQLLKP